MADRMPRPKPGDRRVPVTLKAERAEVLSWEAAALAAAGMSRQAWCKAVLNAAAEVSALPDALKAARRLADRLKKAT